VTEVVLVFAAVPKFIILLPDAVALSDWISPWHNCALDGVITGVGGNGLTVTVTIADVIQPLFGLPGTLSIAFTVYVVPEVGDTV
jgi:hypothetical protein